MAIILDIVLAHTANSHPFAQMYPHEESPWYGPGLGEQNQFGFPSLDYTKEATQTFTRDVQNYWLQVFHIDGLRYDYIHGIGSQDGAALHSGHRPADPA
jgi:1,4-alpha-glucan branching enzyme